MNRIGFIGGSDLYSIMNGDWVQLYDIKAGLVEPPDLSDQFNVQLGTHTERFNIEWMCKQSGYASTRLHYKKGVYQYEYSQTISGVPYKGQLDDIVMSGGKEYVCEAKHTSSFMQMPKMLETYMPQMHLYMRLSGIKQCVFTVIFGNKHEHCVVDFDEFYWKNVHNYVVQFWSFVEKNQRPPSASPRGIDWSEVKINGLTIRDANKDNEFIYAVHNFVNTSQGHREHEEAKKVLKSLVKDTEREVFCDLLSIKRDKRGSLRIKMNEDVA